MDYALTNSNISDLRAEDLNNHHAKESKNIFTSFISWCDGQERNSFLWLALTFITQIGLTLPITAVFIIFFGGNNLLLWIITGMVNVPVLTLTLSAFPTKIRLPFVFFGWLSQAVIVTYCIGFAMMH